MYVFTEEDRLRQKVSHLEHEVRHTLGRVHKYSCMNYFGRIWFAIKGGTL